MDKQNYMPPYDSSDVYALIERFVDDCIIDDEYDSKDLDELEAIIEEAMKEFNDSILNDEDDDELDYQDLRADMYQAIENAVVKNYSKVIK